jgi:hypothetical protein
MNPPSLYNWRRKPHHSKFHAGHTLQQLAAYRKQRCFLLLDCIHLQVNMRVENRDAFLDSRDLKLLAFIPAGERFREHDGGLSAPGIVERRVLGKT